MLPAVLINGCSRPSKELGPFLSFSLLHESALSGSNASEPFMPHSLPRDVLLFLSGILSTGLVFPQLSLGHSSFR
jgi:hypothetical protein